MPVNTSAYFQNPASNKLYGSIAAKYVPKNSAGLAAKGWKTAGGVKGGAISIGSEVLGNYLKPKEEQPIIDGEWGGITNKYNRRLQTAGPGILGGAVKGAGQGAQYGGWYGAAAGALIGGAYGAAKKHSKTAYSDFLPEDSEGLITDAYRQYLGRDPEAGAVDSWKTGQGWKPGDKGIGQHNVFEKLNQIKNSPEAMQYSGIPTPGNPGVNTGPTNFSPMPIPSSFLSPEKVAMLDESRRRQMGY